MIFVALPTFLFVFLNPEVPASEFPWIVAELPDARRNCDKSPPAQYLKVVHIPTAPRFL